MCVLALAAPVLQAFGVGGAAATSTGATAAAGSALSLGQMLQIGGTVAGAAGRYAQGQIARQSAEANIAQIDQQRKTEAQLTAIREERARARYKSAMGTQRAQLSGRGVSLDSPTAVLLGQTAAREMSYEAQAIRAGGQATQTELSGQQSVLRARGTQALLSGGLSAAGLLLNRSPDLWPELAS